MRIQRSPPSLKEEGDASECGERCSIMQHSPKYSNRCGASWEPSYSVNGEMVHISTMSKQTLCVVKLAHADCGTKRRLEVEFCVVHVDDFARFEEHLPSSVN